MSRVKTIIADTRYREYLSRVAVYELDRQFCCHDWEHLLAVCRISYILVLEDANKLNKEMIYAAGLLHDIGRWQEYETGEDHARAGGRLAGPILRDAGFEVGEISLIVTAINEHRGVGSKESYLGRIISKADNLSRQCLHCQVKAACYKVQHMPALNGETIY